MPGWTRRSAERMRVCGRAACAAGRAGRRRGPAAPTRPLAAAWAPARCRRPCGPHDTTLATDQAHLMHPLHHPSAYAGTRMWVKGEGARITDSTGREYIDGLSGLWNVNIGHGRRELADAAQRADGDAGVSFGVCRRHQRARPSRLAERLSGLAYPSINTFFFTSGGAESSETSFKTARFYWKALGKPDKVKVISRQRAYHGLTLAAMSATGLPVFWPMFEPRTPGFSHIDAPDPYRFAHTDTSVSLGVAAANKLEEAILREGPDTVAAFIAEPVQGAGGVIVPPRRLLPAHPRDLRPVRRAAHRRRGHHRLRAHRQAGSGWSTTASSPTSCSSPRGSPAATCRSAASACRTASATYQRRAAGTALDARLHLFGPSDVLRRGAGESRHLRAEELVDASRRVRRRGCSRSCAA